MNLIKEQGKTLTSAKADVLYGIGQLLRLFSTLLSGFHFF